MSIDIRLKHSAIANKAPQPSDLKDGELALNTNAASPAAYIKDSAGNIVKLAGAGAIGGTPASETVAGIAELATQAETNAGTDDQRIVTPLKLNGFQQQFTIQSATPPTLVTHPNIVSGTIWVDTSQNPPVINLWDPTANSGAGGWEELSSVPKPINPGPSDFAVNPAFVSGTGTQADPFIITPSTVATPGGTAQSAQQLSLTGLKVGAAINWTDHSIGAGTRFQQTIGTVPASGNVSLRLAYSDTPNSTANTPYTGDLQLGTTYFRWVVTQQATGVTTPTITSPSAGAADLGETPTFTSSAFAGMGATHASSDWQVTLATDAAFASPVVQSMADATHKVSWDGGPLQTNTDYIVRVRHNGTGSISSAWSAVVAFKTAKKFSDVLSSPGDIYAGNTSSAAFLTLPVKVVALHVMDDTLAIGVDKKIYVGATGSTATLTDSGVTLVDFPISGHSSYGGVSVGFTMPDGSYVSSNKTAAGTHQYSFSGGRKAVQTCCDTASSRAACLLDNGEVLYGSKNTQESDWTSIHTNANYTWISAGKATWTGVVKPVVFACKKDGTVDEIDAASKVTVALPLTGISTITAIYAGWVLAMKSDGSTILSGGNVTSKPIAASFTPPAGEHWVGVAGGYTHAFFETNTGRLFGISNPSSKLVPIWKGAAPADGQMGEINLPRPIKSLSLQKMAAGGYEYGFILP